MGEKRSALPLASSRLSQAAGPVRARRGHHALPIPGIQLARDRDISKVERSGLRLCSCGGSPEAHKDFAEDLLAVFVRVDNVAIE